MKFCGTGINSKWLRLFYFLFSIAVNITIESEGILSVSHGGYEAGGGVGAGIGHSRGSSGASHGGVGGKGSGTAYATLAHDSVHRPTDYGSGGGNVSKATTGHGGGVLDLVASGYVEIDGVLTADGQDASETAVGGGSGGSIFLKAGVFSG